MWVILYLACYITIVLFVEARMERAERKRREERVRRRDQSLW